MFACVSLETVVTYAERDETTGCESVCRIILILVDVGQLNILSILHLSCL